jgi:hypothetical protein
MEHLPMPVFLSRPEIVPASPEALIAEIHRQEAMEVWQAFFG